jgi:hypothetical protein
MDSPEIAHNCCAWIAIEMLFFVRLFLDQPYVINYKYAEKQNGAQIFFRQGAAQASRRIDTGRR